MADAFEKYRQLTDSELIDLVICGDGRASEYIVLELCGPRLQYLARVKYSGAGLEFEELASETWLSLEKNNWKALRDYKGRNSGGVSCSIKTYVTTIAVRILLKKKSAPLKEIAWTVPLSDVEEPRWMDNTIERLKLEDVIKAIMSMPVAKEREALLLRTIQDRSVEEVARLLNINENYVSVLCNRARKTLLEMLEEGRAGHANMS